MSLTRQFLVTLLILTPALPAAAQTPSAKLDESLRQSLQQGCDGRRSVIIRTTPGYRQGLRDALSRHGNEVKGEFPELEAVAAEVNCEDLETLAGFTTVSSVSVNARVGVHSLSLITAVSGAQAAVDAAKAALTSAKDAAKDAQKDVRDAESDVHTAQANLAAAQKAAARASIATKTTALANVTAMQAALTAKQVALTIARAQAIASQAAALDAQEALAQAREALGTARTLYAAREREGYAARDLKRKFFATMPLSSDWQLMTDAQLDTNDESTLVNAFGQTSSTTWGGSSIGVAVIDSGIEPGIDFGNRIASFYDFTQGDIRAVGPSDQFGHGTHVAGLIASQYVGIAPNARLVGLKVLDSSGQGTTVNVVRAIEFAIANRALLGIHVLNISLGHPIYEPAATDPLVQAVEHATRSGLTVVVSAGNFGMNPANGHAGYAGIASPGNAPSALSVGATRTFNTITRADDRIAPYSSRGPSWYDGFAKPDFVAPGDNLLSVAAAGSTLRTVQESRGNTGNYMRLSGTSMAAAVSSGVVALVLDANRGLTPNTVKAVLEFSSIPLKDENGLRYDALTQGVGQIEITGALAYARAINPLAPLGARWLSSSVTPTTVIGAQVYPWSQSIIWGARRVAGQTLLSEQRPAWALNIVWGEGLGSEDDNIVWGNNFGDGDNIVWGNSFDLGDNIVWGNNIVWANDDNIVWGNLFDDNIVWGNDDNIVWGNQVVWGDGLIGMGLLDDNIVWGNGLFDDNIVWGNLNDDNIVWGNLFDDNIVWGNSDDDNIVWGNSDDDNIVWGNNAELGNVMRWSGGIVIGKANPARARRTHVQKVVVR